MDSLLARRDEDIANGSQQRVDSGELMVESRSSTSGIQIAEFRIQNGISWCGEFRECVGGEVGPVAASDFGDGEQRTPIVPQPIKRAWRHRRPAILDPFKIILGPAGELLVEGGFEVGVEFVEPGFDLAGFGFDEWDVDGAVMECAGQFAEATQDSRGKGFE